ncbi:MAG: hypothetical protein Q7J84_03350 [Sulfuricaulis sp.]|nr:hypothetical protein [Sulfuricaulis sp.]
MAHQCRALGRMGIFIRPHCPASRALKLPAEAIAKTAVKYREAQTQLTC